MNILVIHNYYKDRGGEDAVFENEVRELKRIGHNVLVYTRHNNEIDGYGFLAKLKFVINCFLGMKTAHDLKRIVRDNKIDIAHVHNVFPLITPAAYRILKKNRVRVVQTIHNYRFLCPNGLLYTKGSNCQRCLGGNFFNCVKYRCYKESFLFSLLYALMVMSGQKIFKSCIDGYIALTEYVRGLFVNAGFDEKKIFVKDNGFVPNKKNIGKSKGYFLYLARLSKEKGIDFILESFARLKKYRLVVAGIGDRLDHYKKNYNFPNIQFTGFVKSAEKEKLLRNAGALVVPSVWYENYPVSIIEAFSYGLPVIASETGGIPYIIKNNFNGLLFKPGNFESLDEALGIYTRNKTLRSRLGENAKRTFVERMEFSANIRLLEDIYQKVLAMKVNVGGIMFDNVDMAGAVGMIERRIREYKGAAASFVCIANQDIISRCRHVEGLSCDYINRA